MTPEVLKEGVALCEDIHAMCGETRKHLADCIATMDRIIATQEAWDTDQRGKRFVENHS